MSDALTFPEDLIEKVARAICQFGGHRSDDLVLAYPMPIIGPKGHVVVGGQHHLVEAWTLYKNDAYAALVTVTELGWHAPLKAAA